MISWTDVETEKLADAIAHARMKYPTSTFIELVRSAIETHLPEKRRREIKSVQMIPALVQLVEQKLIEIKADADSVQSMQDQLRSRKSADEILDGLSDFEIKHRFRAKIISLLTLDDLLANFTSQQLLDGIPLSDLAAEAMRRYVLEAMTLTPRYAVQEQEPVKVTPRRLTKPSILFMGLKAEQFNHVQDALSDMVLCYHAAAGDKPAGKYDAILLWTKFVSHSDQSYAQTLVTPDRLLRRSGGLTAMIDSVRAFVVSNFYTESGPSNQ